jgi:hypothetical protein
MASSLASSPLSMARKISRASSPFRLSSLSAKLFARRSKSPFTNCGSLVVNQALTSSSVSGRSGGWAGEDAFLLEFSVDRDELLPGAAPAC